MIKRKISLLLALLLALVVVGCMTKVNDERVRKSVCAGTWYTGDKADLARQVDSLLNSSGGNQNSGLKAIIVPHAGYAYSGGAAAKAFSQIPKTTKKIMILGTSHHYPLRGASVDDVDYYETPLGRVKLCSAAAKLRKEPGVASVPEASAEEHSIEIELPFLQRQLADFCIIPVIVGQVDPENFSTVLEKYVDDETLLVISVDLSHFHTQKEANRLDNETIRNILSFDEHGILDCEVDSPYALAAFLNLAKKKGWPARLLEYKTSGDITGDNSSVVGYGAVGFYKMYSEAEKEFALGLARKAVETYVKNGTKISLKLVPEKLKEKRDVFVTLKENGSLRGCIGTLGNPQPIYGAIVDMAISAAVHDTRFEPVTKDELPHLEYEISILTEPEKLNYSSSEELLGKIRGKGVILSKGPFQATYLPQVWEDLPEPDLFLSSLCEKAGLPSNEWKKGVDIRTYEAIVLQ